MAALLEQIDLEGAQRMSAPELLDRRVQESGAEDAFDGARDTLTYAQWQHRAASVAGALRAQLGADAGARLLLWMTNDDAHDFLAALHATFMERLVAVSLDDRSTAREALGVIDETRPAGMVLSTQVARNLGPEGLAQLGVQALDSTDLELVHIVPFAGTSGAGTAVSLRFDDLPAGPATSAAVPSDYAMIFFSSGSTGRPKGAVWTHGDIVAYAERAAHGIYAQPRGNRPMSREDVLQSPIPIYTAAGILENPYVGVLAGSFVVYETRRFDPAASERRMHQHGTTIYNGAPPHFAMMCDLPAGPAPDRLQLMVSGGSAFTEPLFRRMVQRWSGVAVANWYGLMESGCGQTLNFGDDIERAPTAIGRPVWPTEVRVVDDEHHDLLEGEEGELWTRAPGQMREYYRNPQETAKRLADGWLRTGDRAMLDREGRIHIVGRNEERINRGGFKFYPVEIESVLEEHPDVREAAIVGVPHAVLGETPVAFVVPARGAAPDPDGLREYCRGRVAANKIPAQVIIKAALPRTAYGKVVRRALVSEYRSTEGQST